MYEKELEKYQKQIAEAAKGVSSLLKSGAKTDVDAAKIKEAIQSLEQIKKQITGELPEASAECRLLLVLVHEMTGDLWFRIRNAAEAERAYVEMLKISAGLYETDKEKYDYRLGFSSYKRASFYRTILGCTQPMPKPKELDENQKKVFGMTEGLYKNAIAAAMNQTRKGALRYVDLHAQILSELAVMYAAVGNYPYAISCADDGIRLDKAVYAKIDDKVHGFRLASRMNMLASICIFAGEKQRAMETLEDAVYVLEEQVAEDPVAFGTLLARNYQALGQLYGQIEGEQEKVDDARQKAAQYLADVQKRMKEIQK